MKTIIAGGRSNHINKSGYEFLETLLPKITEVVSGGAEGIDKDGEIWAQSHGIPVRVFNAEWNVHGKSAGPKRNYAMAEYADALVIFPGGTGSKNMFKTAGSLKLDIYDPCKAYT